ncbi:hypothetical protein [Sorangium sp. So ce1000]|uniref:hypothetical protein n=1 Tax=Sorangium sp. So ce1000 TaxID=3133325 RepID=UPI003F609F8B
MGRTRLRAGEAAAGRRDALASPPRRAPVATLSPYATPNAAIYLCSSPTPPGGGVHAMRGDHAAAAALRRVFQRPAPALAAPAPRAQLPPHGT